MDVLVLIDDLDELIRAAKPVPLTDQVRVDKDAIYEALDLMRATIPDEIKNARWIVKERQDMLEEARREAERVIEEARALERRLLAPAEIARRSAQAADDILNEAAKSERQIRLGAEDYADGTLDVLENNLSKFHAAVQRGRALAHDSNGRG